MQLAQALRSSVPVRLALVGAGGKTTAMFQLARELSKTGANRSKNRLVMLSASTHLAVEQCGYVDFHYPIDVENDLAALEPELPDSVILFTGSRQDSGRISGLDMLILDQLLDLAVRRNCPLLVEADGSCMRPAKAPAAHEPVIPPWVSTVVVCAGLSAIGKPLNSEWVHRPELFAQLSGIKLGEAIEPGILCSVLSHQQGGLKSVPAVARRILLLNQADTVELQSIARTMAGGLLEQYHAVVITALAPGGIQKSDRDDASIFAMYERVAGIVLAAGGSQRLGSPKQILPWQGEPIVRHVARSALEAGLQPVIVVTGATAEDVQAALSGLPIQTVHNPNWKSGQSTSVKAGLRFVPDQVGAAVYLLADQPRVSRQLISSLVELHATTGAPLVAPLVQGMRANPVLFDRQTFPALLALEGDVGGRPLFSRYRAAWLPWHDSSILLDVDSPDDYIRLLEE